MNSSVASSPESSITGGMLELRRVAVVSGSETDDENAGMKFTWTACGAVGVGDGQ